MKIESKVLEEFLKIVRMNEINDCLMNFNDDGLSISAASSMSVNFVLGTIKKDKFKDYTALGTIAVDNLYKLTTIIKKFKSEIDISIKGNVMIISHEKKSLEFELLDENSIAPFVFEKEIPFDTILKISTDELRSFFDDISVNTDDSIMVETYDGGFKLYNTGRYKFTYNIKSEETKSGVKVKFKEPFYNALSTLTGDDITLQVKSDFPTTAFYKTKTADYKFMIAPRVEKK